MKEKLSITIEKDTIEVIENNVKEGSFRNKSHMIEYAINSYLKNQKHR